MKRFLMAAVLPSLIAGCAMMGAGKPAAVATLEPTKGNAARGTVTFTQDGDAVRVSANLSGLKPGAEHGFHIHERIVRDEGRLDRQRRGRRRRARSHRPPRRRRPQDPAHRQCRPAHRLRGDQEVLTYQV